MGPASGEKNSRSPEAGRSRAFLSWLHGHPNHTSQGGEMTTQNNLEENKRIVRAFIETAFNQHEANRAADYMTSDIKWHGGTLGTVEGREQFAGLIGAIVSAL